METAATTPAVDELKLTSNVFGISQGDKFKVTVESVLIGNKFKYLFFLYNFANL